MDHIVSVLFFQMRFQHFSHSDDRVFHLSFFGIRKCFLRMCMVDQDLRHLRILLDRKVFSQQNIGIQQTGIRRSSRIHRIIIGQQIIKILQLFH